MKTIALLSQVLSGLAALSAYANLIPSKYAPLATLAFILAACIKDIIIHIGDYIDDGQMNNSYQPPTNGGSSKAGGPPLMLAAISVMLAGILFCGTGCNSPHLAAGGAYAPAIISTNADGSVSVQPTAAPDAALFVADTAYKLAYDAVDGVLLFEYNNRAELQQKIPSLKPALDKIRPQVWDIEQRWAKARAAYVANPIPVNLGTLQAILGEMQRLVPAAQAVLAAY